MLLGNKRSDPNTGLEAALPNLFQDRNDIPAKRLAGVQPVTHRHLVAVVNLNVAQLGKLLGNNIQVLEHLIGSYPWTEAVPRTPSGRHRLKEPLGMIPANARR